MRISRGLALVCLSGVVGAGVLAGEALAQRPAVAATHDLAASSPVALDWAPPEWGALGQAAEVKNSFVFDRTMLGVAAGLIPESESGARQAVRKLDGMSVRFYRFRGDADPDPALLEGVRQAYHARGWKHLVTTSKGDGPLHNGKTDVWLAMDGVDVRGGTLLLAAPRSLCLVTFAGDLSPIDLLHLRGHFGIPSAGGDKLEDAR